MGIFYHTKIDAFELEEIPANIIEMTKMQFI